MLGLDVGLGQHGEHGGADLLGGDSSGTGHGGTPAHPGSGRAQAGSSSIDYAQATRQKTAFIREMEGLAAINPIIAANRPYRATARLRRAGRRSRASGYPRAGIRCRNGPATRQALPGNRLHDKKGICRRPDCGAVWPPGRRCRRIRGGNGLAPRGALRAARCSRRGPVHYPGEGCQRAHFLGTSNFTPPD